MKLVELHLEIDSIVIGERVKGGIFRPCQDTIPSSTIEGALRHYFGFEVPAVGLFEENTYEVSEFTYSVADKFLNTSKIPFITAYLRPKDGNKKIKARVYIPYNKGVDLKNDLKNTEFQMGALKSRGFGSSKIVEVEEIECEIKQGILNVKIFEEEAEEFGIKWISPVYGYLFKPNRFLIDGVYKKGLFPGSLVEAPTVLLKGKEVTYYDKEDR
ncbi:hypothetical protein JCM16816_21510 [Thermoanaerobacter brockii subsp. lactiethylicus]|jgi:hypothetical protein|uniref:hypothetical protein n=1 Tax=Thermoanaerobacter sp. TaxID=1755 RepID=UPI003464033F